MAAAHAWRVSPAAGSSRRSTWPRCDPAGARVVSGVSASLVCAACGTRHRWRDPRRRHCACAGLLCRSCTRRGPRGRGAADAPRSASPRRRRPCWAAACGASASCCSRAAGRSSRTRGQHAPLLGATPSRATPGVDDLALKHEGENPTGSFKDRGMTVAVDAGCARRRYRGRLRVHRQHLRVDGRLRRPGGRARAGVRAGRARWRRGSWPRRSRTAPHAAGARRLRRLPAPGARGLERAAASTLLNSVNPWRIEGQKTIVLELLQQRGWEPPDWIVVPAGNLGNTAAFGKALREARELRADLRACRASPPSRPRARRRSSAASERASRGATG